jgi:hypothetical protein
MSNAIAHDEQRVAPSDEGDIIRTAAGIGRALGLSTRAAYHLVHSGSLRSVKKIGGRFYASRSRLLEEVTGIEND